jgi:tetratricopeptide (TPR) repeat protein
MTDRFSAVWFRWLSAIAIAAIGWVTWPLVARAQLSPVLRDQFLSDPVYAVPRDPLLPDIPVVRPLSPLEKRALAADLVRLNAAAERRFLAGDAEVAFQAWIREVRLRRILGYEAELAAIQRVGLRAWENSRATEVQLLTLRLREIQTELLAQEPLDIPLLEEVAATFEVLRDVDSAIAMYETLIVRATQAGDRDERLRLLANLAKLRENWFRFEVAAETYANLLTATSSAPSVQRVPYFQGAIRNYEDAGALQEAIGYQQRLVRAYEQSAQPRPIPTVTLGIARNYRALNNLSQAQSFYSTTYSTALALGQTDVASAALQDLAEIYLDQNQLADVEYLYQQRLAVERLSYNGYGVMETFGQLGELYERQEEPDAAIAAYKEALIMAEHLEHRDAFYELKLQRLLFAQGRLSALPLEHHLGGSTRPLIEPTVWSEN